KKVYPPGHYSIASGYDALAGVYRALGDLSGAKQLSELAVDTYANYPRPSGGTLAGYMDELAESLSGLHEDRAALDLAQKALTIAETSLGPEDRRIHSYLGVLASIQMNAGDLPAARESYERTLQLRERHFGSSHYSIGETLAG